MTCSNFGTTNTSPKLITIEKYEDVNTEDTLQNILANIDINKADKNVSHSKFREKYFRAFETLQK